MVIAASIWVVCVLAAGNVWAKRTRAQQVEPVIHEGVKYVAPNDDGRRAYIQAYDLATSNKLWEVTVFNNRINPLKEEDVQWIYITRLELQKKTLLVTDERGRQFLISLMDRKVENIKKDKAANKVPEDTARKLADPQHDAGAQK